METYSENAASRYGLIAKQRLLRIFEAFGWPDAGPGEFVEGTESSLLFLNRYGLVLRTGQKMPLPEHDLILQPLAMTSAGRDCAIELLPGVRAIADSLQVAHMLGAVLQDEDIDFHDTLVQNVGYIPAALPAFPSGVPVVIDRGAVSVLNMFCCEQRYLRKGPEIETLRQSFNRSALSGFQERFYQPLRASLRDAWPEDGRPDRAKLAQFLAQCAAEIVKSETGRPALLTNRWTIDGFDAGKPPRASEAGRLYDLRL